MFNIDRAFQRLKRQQSEIKEPEIVNTDKSLFIYQPGQIKLSMNDVGGYKEAKIELMEIVHFFKQLDTYENLGAQPPKGAMFYGEHGVGKSLLVKAAAGECNVPFLSYSCGGFLMGDNGTERLRNVFEIARHMSPCILFLDELQSIAKPRTSKCGKESLLQRSILEEFLIQLDGFEQHSSKPIIVLSATFNLCSIDFALKRPGRFDRLIEIGPPDLEDRKEILSIHLKPIKTSLDKKELAGRYAALTNGFSGANLALLCNEGAMVAGRCGANEVTVEHYDKALERIRFGIRKRNPYEDKVKKIVAYHNAGHALVDYYSFKGEYIKNINLFPSPNGDFVCCTSALLKQTEGHNFDEESLLDIISLLLAGMAAEEFAFGEYTTSSKDDIMLTTVIASDYVCTNGFSKFGKIFTHYWYEKQFATCLEVFSTCGDANYVELFKLMDKIVEYAYDKAKTVITRHSGDVHKLAEVLMNKNSLTFEDIESILWNKEKDIK